MHQNFWLERWQQNQIGFHAEETNPQLQSFWPTIKLPLGATVFVPLCGKSNDLLWLLSQGYNVIGVELSPLAIQAFFAENKLLASTYQQGKFTVSAVEGLRIFCGDFFDLSPEDVAGVQAVYDRAALVALPAAMRTAYAAYMRTLLGATTQILLIAFTYDQKQMPGPPFSVTEQEVQALYGSWGQVDLACSEDILEREARFRERGVSSMSEQVYRISVIGH